MNRMGIKTKSAISQDSQNDILDSDIMLSQIQCPIYLVQNRAIYNRHEIAATSSYNLSLPELIRCTQFQSNFNQMRDALLYGIQPEYGEGIINSPGIAQTVIPADQNGNIGLTEQDAGHVVTFLLETIAEITARTNQSGKTNIFTILGPQRCLKKLETSRIVQLTSYQRPGGGTRTVKGKAKDILEENGDKIFWTYDDTLMNKGTNGADIIIVSMPELNLSNILNNRINTNYFAENGNIESIKDCSAMYTDTVAPQIFTTNLAGTTTHSQAEMKITPGWVLRPEAFTIINAFAEAPIKTPEDNKTFADSLKSIDPIGKNQDDDPLKNKNANISENNSKNNNLNKR